MTEGQPAIAFGGKPTALRKKVYRLLVWRGKILRFRRGNYSRRRVMPFMEWGPFRCWIASWRWGQVSWELTRWS